MDTPSLLDLDCCAILQRRVGCLISILYALLAWPVLCVVNGAAAPSSMAGSGSAHNPQPIAWNELGAQATAQYSGDSLGVSATANGAKLRCVFQKLEGEVTQKGLWLRSTAAGTSNKPFRVEVISVGRERGVHCTPPSIGSVETTGDLARFVRPGLVEEYSVSVDGLRQDFVVLKRPSLHLTAPLSLTGGEDARRMGEGVLRVELSVSGAKAEVCPDGVHLVLRGSGRKLHYHRLRATDATGQELAAKMRVLSPTELAVMVEDDGAVYPVRIDPTFSDDNWMALDLPGVHGDVYAAVVDGSGNVYVGGQFTWAGGVAATNIAKWNGSRWSALDSGLSGNVYALAVSGNDLYVGGDFTAAGSVAATNIAKWNGSGWSALGSGMIGGSIYYQGVLGLTVSGGNLYAGGYFTNAGGVAANHIAKWNGTSWSALGSGTDQFVQALAVSGGDLYAGGGFTTAGGKAANYIAKWNGNTWSALGAGTDGQVIAIAVWGSELYAGGWSTIAKWNGHKWSALGSWGGGSVFALAVSGSDLIVGGAFTTGSAINIAKWNGSSWSALGSGMDRRVWALAVSGGDLYAGGHLTTAGGVVADHVAKWNGNSWSALGAGTNNFWMDGVVRAMAVSGSNLYAGAGDYVAKWDGSSWTVLPNWTADPWAAYSTVYALAVSGDDLYAAGEYLFYGADYDEIYVGRVSKWNGTNWSALGGVGTGDFYDYPFTDNPSVNALAVSGSNLYAGGDFTTAGGVTAYDVAKWNGSSWSALGAATETDRPVEALAVLDGDLYAGGGFTTAGGMAANHIAKWNGTNWSALDSGVTASPDWPFYGGFVKALAVSGSDLYVGGVFTAAGSVAATNIAKWNANNWSALDAGISKFEGPFERGIVLALAVLGTNLYAGGYFTTAGNEAATNIARWDGSNWSELGSGITAHPERGELGSVFAVAVSASGGELYAGGDFMTAGGKTSPNAARASLLSIPALPSLTIGLTAPNLAVVSWPSPSAGFVLQQNTNGVESVNWRNVNGAIQDNGTDRFVVVSPPVGSGFYRLVKP